MRKTLFALVCGLFVFSQVIFAQDPTPTPIEVDDDDVVKISTNLIQVDVTVTDEKGRPIKGLTADDFEVYENGKKRKISGISFISPSNEKSTVKSSGDLDSSLLYKQAKPSDIRRTIALVVDDISLTFENTHHTKRALKHFVENQMQDGDLVALIRTRGSVGTLQQFTTNKRVLRAAIDRLRWSPSRFFKILSYDNKNPYAGVGLASGRNGNPVDPDEFEISVPDEAVDHTQETKAITGTLGTMLAVLDGMKTMPGRKSMIFFSQGLGLAKSTSNYLQSSRALTLSDKLIETANRASVVIYPVEVNGVPYNFSGFGGLKRLAKDTGGIVIYNTNDLKGGVEKILNDQSYYLIAYEPEEESFDPNKIKFNEIKVKVLRDDVKIRNRKGFFNIADKAFDDPLESLTKNDKILTAAVYPFAANDINLRISTNFKGNERDELFVDSYLHINASDLKFTKTKDGSMKAVFDIFAASFDNSGLPTDQISKTFTIEAKGKTLEKVLRDGFVYYFTMPIKKSGAYQIRAAILDQATDKVGSASEFIVLPKIWKNRLTLSGVLLDNISYQKWSGEEANRVKTSANKNHLEEDDKTAMMDTALREFKRGTVLSYALEIYNANKNTEGKNALLMRTRLYHKGKLIHEGKDVPMDTKRQKNSPVKKLSGALNLNTDLALGDYVLQIIVTDKLAKEKHQIATQLVQFELVK